MAVDTIFDYVLLKTVDCVLYDYEEEEETDTTCPGTLYDPETSDDYEDFDEPDDNIWEIDIEATETYGTGYLVTDTVCLDATEEDLCIENFLWGTVLELSNIPAIFAGIFGMPTGNSPILPVYMKELVTAEIFSEYIFAIAFKGLAQTTFMDIGEIFDENMSDEDDIVYFSTASRYWGTTISGIQFGENTARQFTVPTAAALFDSASPMIVVPESQWEVLINQLVRELDYDQYTIDLETYTCSVVCDPSIFYDMYFFIGGEYWAQLLAEDFIVDLSLDQNGNSCQIAISNTTNPYWSLGLPFLRGYYVVFDGENSQTGIVPYNGSPKDELYEGIQPEATLTLDEGSDWATYGVIAAIIVILGAYIGSAYIGG